MVHVVPVHLSPAVVIGMDQLMCESIVHVPLRVDVVLTQDNLLCMARREDII